MPVAEGPEAFFGYIGVACALVFASKEFKDRLGSGLRNGQVGSGNRLYGCIEARPHHEVYHPSGHGRYFGHLRHDRRSHPVPEN